MWLPMTFVTASKEGSRTDSEAIFPVLCDATWG
jgi:hypothetical protein